MKNLKIYKKAIALTTIVGITLFSGCSSSNQQKNNGEVNSVCHHMIVEFGDQPVIFRECDGYDIEYYNYKGDITYKVSYDDETLINGSSNKTNYYEAIHSLTDEIEEQAIEKGAYVYKLN